MNPIITKWILKVLGYVLDFTAVFLVAFILFFPEHVGVLVGKWFDRFFCSFLLTIDPNLMPK